MSAVERTCERCSYAVASSVAGTHGPAERAFPETCRQCGGDLVPAGGETA